MQILTPPPPSPPPIHSLSSLPFLAPSAGSLSLMARWRGNPYQQSGDPAKASSLPTSCSYVGPACPHGLELHTDRAGWRAPRGAIGGRRARRGVPSFPRSRWCVEAGEGRARRDAPALLLRSARPCPSSLPAGVGEEDGARISLFGGEGAGRSRAHPSGREGAGRVEELTAAGRLRLRWRGVRAGKAAGGAAASLSTHPSVLEGGAAASPSSCGGQAAPLLVG
jgi:hypothetical protein